MIIEQIRYYIRQDDRDMVLQARREVARLREQLGVPPGRLLIADPIPDEGPALVWQCAYEDDEAMAAAETALLGNAEYEAVREQLGTLGARVELELYTIDEDEG